MKEEKEQEKIIEAQSIIHWSIFGDKTTDPKPSDMTVEEAESILHEQSHKKIILF